MKYLNGFTKNENKVLALMINDCETHDAVGWVKNCQPKELANISFPGVVGSLVKKGLIVTFEEDHMEGTTLFFQFTKKGAALVDLDTSTLEVELP